MALANLDMETVKDRLYRAVDQELPLIDELREQVRNLNVQELGYRQCYAIAPVATDGGENNISFEPVNLEIIRVVDSEGTEHFQDFIPLSSDPSIFKEMFEQVDVLKKFLKELGVTYNEISYLLPSTKVIEDYEKGIEREKIDNRDYIKIMRDIAEWAVLLDLSSNPGRTKLLLLRDGLLRTKMLNLQTIEIMKQRFKRSYKENGTLLLGVAKSSKVLNYLSLGLALEGTFDLESPCFCEVPEELEKRCYKWERTWMTKQFGRMHLVKLAQGKGGLVLPIDIPEWLLGQRKEVLEYLAETARSSFPVVGYPHPLIKAHENAVIHGLEMSVFSDLLIKRITAGKKDEDIERIIRHVNLGKGLIRGGIRE